VHGVPDVFSLTSFHDAMLISVELGRYHVNLGFDGRLENAAGTADGT
jgi:hypothetical protein